MSTPEQIAETSQVSPMLSSHQQGWRGIVLQRYNHSGNRLEAPAIRSHALSVRLSGQAFVEQKDENGRLERYWTDGGQMSLVPAGGSASRLIKGKSDVFLIHLSPEIVTEVVGTVFERDPVHVSLRRRFAHPEQQIENVGRLLLAEAENGGCGTGLVADMLARTLAIHLLRHHSNLSADAAGKTPMIAGSRLRRTLEFMHEHLSRDLSLSELAYHSGLSQPHFARAFREAVGDPPHRYLIMLRIQKARSLLENSDLPVTQVAVQCGYLQPNHFAYIFRKSVGMSPRSWRHMRQS